MQAINLRPQKCANVEYLKKSFIVYSWNKMQGKQHNSHHTPKELVPFTQLVKVMRGQVVLALPNIRFS